MTENIQWILKQEHDIPEAFKSAIGGHPLVAQTLYQRGIRTIDAAQAFLDPDRYTPTSADAFPDIQVAYQLLAEAIQYQKHILVWGDFDVDGQTSTTLLVHGLRELGGMVSYHIPVRAKESHGIKFRVLKSYLDKGFDLLLTCDTGISEHQNIQYVMDAGIPVIITDHHTLPDTLPPANAVINPQRLPEDHPLRTLPGVGVAYQLIEGLYDHMGVPFHAKPYLELAALGIVADVAEIRADTRYLLQKGLLSLRHTNRLGLQTLYQHAEINPHHLNEGHIGFQIAPRMNAIGRLGDANPMVEFLLTEDTGRARVLATQIEALNAKRRFESRQVEKAAEGKLQSSADDRHSPAIILHHPSWPGGIVGIVASRLVERYQKPAILLTGEDPIHGSARSVPGVNITEVITSQAELLNAFGGHPMAAGLSMPASQYQTFKNRILAEVEAIAGRVAITPTLEIDQVIHLDEITLEFVAQIERLAPFGAGFPALNFMIEGLTLVSHTAVGQGGEHRQVTVEDKDGNQLRFIWWNGGDAPLPEAQFDLICTLSTSDYKGSPQVSAVWLDFRLSEHGKEEIAERQFEVTDLRGNPQASAFIKKWLKETPQCLVWAEDEMPPGITGVPRHQLTKTEALIIWTAPPSQKVLEETVLQTKPKKILVLDHQPKISTHLQLMERVAGLAKYAINHKAGLASLVALAAACAVDVEAIRLCLQYWEAKGALSIKFEGDMAYLKLANRSPDPSTPEIYVSILHQMVEEINAYRAYFTKADLKSLFPTIMPLEKPETDS